MSVCGHTLMMVPTRDVRNELLIVLYLNIHVGHDKNQYIPIWLYLRSTQRCINVHVRLNVRHIFAILIHAVIDHCNKNSWYM